MKGEIDKALDFYLKSEKIDEESLLAKYQFAKFLADKLRRYDKAIKKCDEIISEASSHPRQKSEEDLSSKHYLSLCYALQGYCNCLLEDFEKAGEKLLELLKIKEEESLIDYAVKLCDLLISNGYYVSEAKGYLTCLKMNLVEKGLSENYYEFMGEIEKILNK